MVLFFKGKLGHERLILLALVSTYMVAQFTFENINDQFICYEPANIVLPLLVIFGLGFSHYSLSIKKSFSSIVFFLFLALMMLVIYLKFINGFVRYMLALYWVFLVSISSTFDNRNDLSRFLVISLIVSLFAIVQVENPPVPKSLWYVWYPILTGLTFLGFDRNISNRKKLNNTQALILKQQNEITQLFNNLPVMIIIKDKDNNIVRANEAFANFVGEPVEHFNNLNLYKSLSKEKATKYHHEDLEIISSKTAKRNIIERLDFIELSSVWIRADKFPYYDLNGEISGVLIVSVDITSEILAKQNLVKSDQRFEVIFNEAPYGMAITDLDDKIVQVNHTFCDLLGYEENELLGKGIRGLVKPEKDSVSVYQNDQLVNDNYEIERQYIRKDGESILTKLKVSVVRDEDKKPQFTIGTIEDITATKKAEEKLKEYSKALEDSNKELEQFAYAASHDLKEPLRMIKSYINILNKRYSKKLDEAAQEFIGYTIEGVDRMSALITDLLQYSRVGRTDFEKVSIQFDTILFKVLSNLRMQINETKTDFNINIENTELYVNKTQFALLLQNLLSNAIKYRKDIPPQITINAILKEEYWEFSVNDNGIGMEKKDVNKVFQIFHRLHTHQDYQGTGIGLAICKRIVNQHGGNIWAESEKGVGSTFYFTIPHVKYKPPTPA